MDGIREQLVRRPLDSADKVKKIIILLAALVLAVLVFAGIYFISDGMLTPIAFLFAGLVIWGGWWLSEQLNVEYEYVVFGGEMTVDKIINKGRRKTLCEVDLRSSEGFYKSEKRISGAALIEAFGDGEIYSIEYTDKKHGKAVLIFTPDERTLEMIKPYLPRLS